MRKGERKLVCQTQKLKVENENFARRVTTLSHKVRNKDAELIASATSFLEQQKEKAELQEENFIMRKRLTLLELKAKTDSCQYKRKQKYREKKLAELDKEIDDRRKSVFKLR